MAFLKKWELKPFLEKPKLYQKASLSIHILRFERVTSMPTTLMELEPGLTQFAIQITPYSVCIIRR
jgi:hypothetical protein